MLMNVPRTVWALGLVSLFMDLSSEIIHALLPVFLTTTLGASVALVGLIDGVGESAASITKVFSGYISDRLGRRKPLILLGYGLGALSKPFFAIATGPMPILGARFVDRIGKGLRGAPRDALVADVTPVEIRGRAYGLRQALDTIGAFLGPLAAIALMFALANDMRTIFWIALIPAVISVLLVVFGVGEAEKGTPGKAKAPPLRMVDLKSFDRRFWLGVVAAFVGIALWGLHMALTQGLMAKLVADRAPPDLRGSAFGMFNLAAGVAMLFASVVAGLLWDRLGANSTFLAGAGFATVALIGLALNRVGSETVST